MGERPNVAGTTSSRTATKPVAGEPGITTNVNCRDAACGGVGESTIAVVAPAVLNALFAATGKRLRNPPLKNSQL